MFLFTYENITTIFAVWKTQNEEILRDLERLKNVIDNIPDGRLIYKLNSMHEEQLEKCKYLLADNGYDDTKIIEYLKGKDITTIIDTDIYNNKCFGEWSK